MFFCFFVFLKLMSGCIRFILRVLEPVCYVCLKTENCCLKTFVEIRVGEKVP